MSNIMFFSERSKYFAPFCYVYALVDGHKFFINDSFSTETESNAFANRLNEMDFSEFPCFSQYKEACLEIAHKAFAEKWYSIGEKFMRVSANWGYSETSDNAHGGLPINDIIFDFCREYSPVWDITENDIKEYIEYNAWNFYKTAVEDYVNCIC